MILSLVGPFLLYCSILTLPFARTHESSRGYNTGDSRIDESSESHDLHFFKFVTRPDIQAPRWDIKVYNKSAVSTGFWFVATYEYVEQTSYDNRAWVGPLIYSQDGELVWSGAPTFKGYNVKDFKVSNVNGVDMLTGIFARENKEVILSSNYTVHKTVPVEDSSFVNIHGFTTVDSGTRSLAMTARMAPASLEELASIEHQNGDCRVFYPGFEERDTQDWTLTFEWSSQGHILLDEALLPAECDRVWDYLHANSIDKFPDGDYLLSARYSDAVYKISGQDGKIVWRLGGRNSDFDFADHFSGQHDAQVREQNETHVILSLLDNAYRPGPLDTIETTNDMSRGMIISLDTGTKPMTAQVISVYNHPYADYAQGRGNFQIVETGNRFIAWWMRSLISEHSPDGRLLMQASWKPELKSYRSYKYNWIGQPDAPPDVYAEATTWTPKWGSKPEHAETVFYVSWNGATEVDRWVVHSATQEGQKQQIVGSSKRTGFETKLVCPIVVQYAVVTALDRLGNFLGESVLVGPIQMRVQEKLGHGLPFSRLSSFGQTERVVGMVICAVLLGAMRRLQMLRRRSQVTMLGGADSNGSKMD